MLFSIVVEDICFLGSYFILGQLFQVSKRYEDIENLRRKLISCFHGTAFPQLPKSLFSFGDSAINERRSALDGFLKFIASRSKCVLSRHTLEFLGLWCAEPEFVFDNFLGLFLIYGHRSN